MHEAGWPAHIRDTFCITKNTPISLVLTISNMPFKELNFITGNKNKLAEVQAILAGVVPLRSQSLDLIEIQGTIEEISKDKCRRAAATV